MAEYVPCQCPRCRKEWPCPGDLELGYEVELTSGAEVQVGVIVEVGDCMWETFDFRVEGVDRTTGKMTSWYLGNGVALWRIRDPGNPWAHRSRYDRPEIL